MAFVDPALEQEDEEFEEPGELEPVSDEDRARAMGWRPMPADPRNPQPHEYRGDPRRWTDAAEFIRHGEEELPILRDQNRRMSERLARTDGQIATLTNTVEEQRAAITAAVNLAKRADERGYQRGLVELQAKRREAVEAGDTESFDQVQQQIDALENTRAEIETPPAAAPPPAKPALAPEYTEFTSANPWLDDATRPYLRQAMVAAHNAVIAKYPSMALRDQLARALDTMRASYPEMDDGQERDEEFEDEMPPRPAARPPRRAPSALPPSGGPINRTPPGRGSPLDRITDPEERKDARAAFESIRRQDPGMSEAEYMAIYEDPHADVVALRSQRKK